MKEGEDVCSEDQKMTMEQREHPTNIPGWKGRAIGDRFSDKSIGPVFLHLWQEKSSLLKG